tara:strand:- start:18676 stop:19827 length:1152 start_codon:yes stop_codon:yes gene_type:complete
MQRSNIFLIDHPGLHTLLLPLMRALKEAQQNVMALVCDHGIAGPLAQEGFPYVTQFEELQHLARRMGEHSVFITASDQQFMAHKRGREFVQLAKLHGFPTVSIQHGPFALVERQNQDVVSDSSLLFTFGRAEYDFFHSLGMEEDRLVITGCPKYDELNRVSLSSDSSRSNKILVLGALHTQQIICNYSREECAELLFRVLSALKKDHPDSTLYVKPHPAEVTSVYELLPLYQDVISRFSADDVVLVDASDSFLGYARESKFVVSFSSSSIVELLLINRPVLYINEYYYARTNRVLRQLQQMKAVAVMQSAEFLKGTDVELPELSIDILDENAQDVRNVLMQLNFMNDGNACARMVALISRLGAVKEIETIDGVPRIFCAPNPQ